MRGSPYISCIRNYTWPWCRHFKTSDVRELETHVIFRMMKCYKSRGECQVVHSHRRGLIQTPLSRRMARLLMSVQGMLQALTTLTVADLTAALSRSNPEGSHLQPTRHVRKRPALWADSPPRTPNLAPSGNDTPFPDAGPGPRHSLPSGVGLTSFSSSVLAPRMLCASQTQCTRQASSLAVPSCCKP